MAHNLFSKNTTQYKNLQPMVSEHISERFSFNVLTKRVLIKRGHNGARIRISDNLQTKRLCLDQ